MRLYEFSKKHDLSSKELVTLLKNEGFEVTSHMSTLSEKAQKFLEKKFNIAHASQNGPEKDSLSEPIIEKSKKELSPNDNISILTVQPMTLTDLAPLLGHSVNSVILALLKWGILANKNQVLSEDIVVRLADHYGIKTQLPVAKKEKIRRDVANGGKNLDVRSPVVVILGHVDHGKTTLLDYIRKTRITAKEKGGITQHLGAYEASTKHGNIVFIDTPGHEAFSKIRERGAHVADIAILLVAADDSIMPQTKEAIKFAKEADLPIIVAINKIDTVGTGQIETVKRDLAQFDLLPEEWGGDTICAPVSATKGTGVEHLLEMISLQADLMELKADKKGTAKGYILESQLEKGRGAVATLLLHQGRVNKNDYFICDGTRGRINSIVDSHGTKLSSAGPANPVQVGGFDQLPHPGSFFKVVSKNLYRKGLSLEELPAATPKYVPHDSINIILKTDTLSSKEALIDSVNKLAKKLKKVIDKEFNIVHASVGDITESDIMLASDTESQILGLHVKINPIEQRLAKQMKVSVNTFFIIYKLLEFLNQELEKEKPVKKVRKKVGEAEVRKVFKIKNIGTIAGSYVKSGVISRNCFLVAYRNGEKIGEGNIVSLQRDKKNVKEVHTGYECAFMIEGISDWEPGDTIECFLETQE